MILDSMELQIRHRNEEHEFLLLPLQIWRRPRLHKLQGKTGAYSQKVRLAAATPWTKNMVQYQITKSIENDLHTEIDS